MIKVAVLDDYQDAFRQIVDTLKYKDKYNFKQQQMNPQQQNQSQMYSQVIRARESPAV